jgi:hypothetical protein
MAGRQRRAVVAPADGVVLVGGAAAPLDRVWVQVVIAHDGLLPGQVHEVSYTVRNQNLIGMGYFEIVAPPVGVCLL